MKVKRQLLWAKRAHAFIPGQEPRPSSQAPMRCPRASIFKLFYKCFIIAAMMGNIVSISCADVIVRCVTSTACCVIIFIIAQTCENMWTCFGSMSSSSLGIPYSGLVWGLGFTFRALGFGGIRIFSPMHTTTKVGTHCCMGNTSLIRCPSTFGT